MQLVVNSRRVNNQLHLSCFDIFYQESIYYHSICVFRQAARRNNSRKRRNRSSEKVVVQEAASEQWGRRRARQAHLQRGAQHSAALAAAQRNWRTHLPQARPAAQHDLSGVLWSWWNTKGRLLFWNAKLIIYFPSLLLTSVKKNIMQQLGLAMNLIKNKKKQSDEYFCFSEKTLLAYDRNWLVLYRPEDVYC